MGGASAKLSPKRCNAKPVTTFPRQAAPLHIGEQEPTLDKGFVLIIIIIVIIIIIIITIIITVIIIIAILWLPPVPQLTGVSNFRKKCGTLEPISHFESNANSSFQEKTRYFLRKHIPCL